MPIVKKLSKLCIRCGELYTPSSKYQRICHKCNPTIVSQWLSEFTKTQKKVNRRNKLRERLKVPSNAKKVLAKKKTK